MFFAIARFKNVSGLIRYDNGRLSCDPMLVQLIQGELEANKNSDLGPIMYFPSCGDHSKDPLSIRLIMEQTFDSVSLFGDVPDWPQLPEG